MGLSFLVTGPPSAAYAKKSKFFIHVLKHRGFAKNNTLTQQEDSHATVPKNTAELVVNAFYFIAYFCFTSMISCFFALQIIVVSVGMNPHPIEHPADAEFILMFRNKPISL